MSSSIAIPAEVLSEILEQTSSSSILPLFKLMLVSREWNTLLSTTTSFWRDVKTDAADDLDTPQEVQAILKRACSLSRNSLQSVYILPDWPWVDSKPTLFSLLESSRSTLKRIDMDIPIHWNLSVFRNFNALERLNLIGEVLPEVQPSTPGRLALFAASIGDLEIEDQDLDWFSHLQALYWRNLYPNAPLPWYLLRIIEKCKDSLLLLDFNTGEAPDTNTEIYELPKLETIRIRYCETADDAFNSLKVPKVKEVHCSPHHQFIKDCQEIETLRLQVWCWVDSDRANSDEILQQVIIESQLQLKECVNLSSLKTLQLNSNPDDEDATIYSIDPLLQYLKVTKDIPVACPSLSQLMLSYQQIYDPELLVELLLRQVFSRSRNGDPALCSEVTLYLSDDEDQIAAYREAEEVVLGRMSEEKRKDFRITNVCEGEEDWMWELEEVTDSSDSD